MFMTLKFVIPCGIIWTFHTCPTLQCPVEPLTLSLRGSSSSLGQFSVLHFFLFWQKCTVVQLVDSGVQGKFIHMFLQLRKWSLWNESMCQDCYLCFCHFSAIIVFISTLENLTLLKDLHNFFQDMGKSKMFSIVFIILWVESLKFVW